MRNVPPRMPLQKVYVSVREKEKSNTLRRPVAPAMRKASSTGTGRRQISTATIANNAPTITTICFTSAQATASTPPSTV